MSERELSRAVHAIYIQREATMAARAGDFTILDGFQLTPEERSAIERLDLVALYGLGTHPMALFHLSAVLNPREAYIRDVVPRIQNTPNGLYDYDQHAARALERAPLGGPRDSPSDELRIDG